MRASPIQSVIKTSCSDTGHTEQTQRLNELHIQRAEAAAQEESAILMSSIYLRCESG